MTYEANKQRLKHRCGLFFKRERRSVFKSLKRCKCLMWPVLAAAPLRQLDLEASLAACGRETHSTSLPRAFRS